VEDVGVGGAAEAEHVRRVLDELEGATGWSVKPAPGAAAVEALAHPVAVGLRHRPVEEPAGQQLHLGAGANQRRGERAVVGWREGRGVDQLDADPVLHSGRLW